jgi:transcription-repair coupling factor (superfamily II helicase)
LREHFRGGQSFFVCPRVEDIEPAARRLRALVPEVRIAIAHGQLPARELETVMNAFYDGAYDVLISTAIVESGLDIPTVNTMIVHRAHMFGLAQLYQLRGRIGRSKLRAYAYFTLPPHGGLSGPATKRLEVLHKLDTLGAGFSLASYDLDIRGAGNLLGAEQSGHIREVGLELFQHMLEEAVNQARAEHGDAAAIAAAASRDWTPQINVGAAVLIPEVYVGDLGVRLALYRRLGGLESQADIDAFAAEMIDRFGPLPDSVEHLLGVMTIKQLCRQAGVAKVDAGDEGAVLSFHKESADPTALVAFIGRHVGGVKLRPDHSLVISGYWSDVDERLKGVRGALSELAEIVGAAS